MLITFLPLCVNAQEEDWAIQRGGCLPTGLPSQSYVDGSRLLAPHRLPTFKDQWDATKTYKQLVVLVEFSDISFFESHDKDFYEKVFNVFDESVYEGKARYGQGSVADYYRTQSGGMLNLSFDIVGPYKVQEEAKRTDTHKKSELREATEMMVADQQERDFSQYDWNNDGYIDQVIYVVAGPSGNVAGQKGYLHPNTSTINSVVTTHDGMKILNYTASTEVWTLGQNINCGIGTICHEFSHSLGLPDIYPVTNSSIEEDDKNTDYSVCDEWDLMDGGNFTNYGWCPPNYTPLEKMLLGWLTPIELTEATSIIHLPAVSEGGTVYQIRHSDTEYLLLENRQWTQWDAGLPDKGLLVTYVNYIPSRWRNNTVNGRKSKLLYNIIHADGMDYTAWSAKVRSEGHSSYPYQNANRMNNYHLSTSPYPFEDNNALVDEYITNIQESEDGLISFDFMGGASGIKEMNDAKLNRHEYYDLQGRRIEHPVRGQLYLTRKSDGSICKHLYQ